MPQTEAQASIEEVKRLVFQLRTQDLITLLSDIQERLHTCERMQIAESGFQGWNDEEETFYDAKP